MCIGTMMPVLDFKEGYKRCFQEPPDEGDVENQLAQHGKG